MSRHKQSYAASMAFCADDIAARINEASADDDNIGDIILEMTADGYYTVIEDYKEEITV